MIDNRYLKGKIYIIKNKNDTSKIYVGSTIETLNSRYSKHKHDSKNYKNRCNLYKHVYDWSDWEMTLHEDYPCNNKKELEQREYQIMAEFGEVLNKKKQMRFI
jgi:hypothetical protein